jgi:DNA processing protein
LPGQVFAQSHSRLASLAGTKTAEALRTGPKPEAVEAALAWAAGDGNHLLTLADAAYPKALLEIPDPPIALYVKGNPALLARPALALVGSRTGTAQGEANAEAFARSLGEAGLTIISGLALGIDAAAHRGALETAGGTVAVLGTGIDRIYPAANESLTREIAARGALVSEFPLGMPPARHHFPRRNRLIAGLAQGVLVVEATLNSGSLITARLALESGREVFAIPGSIHSPLARGCHHLIREGAKLVETAEDVLEELRARLGNSLPPRPEKPRTRRAAPARRASAPPARLDLPPEACKVLEALGPEPRDIDSLALATGLTVDALNVHLLTLELEGLAARQPGGGFQRLHRPLL